MINTDRRDKGTNDWIKCPDCKMYMWSDMYWLSEQEHTCQLCGVRRLERCASECTANTKELTVSAE